MMNFRENVKAVLNTNIPCVCPEIHDIITDRICELHEVDLKHKCSLDKIRAEIQESINYSKKMNCYSVLVGLLLALDTIDKYRPKEEQT